MCQAKIYSLIGPSEQFVPPESAWLLSDTHPATAGILAGALILKLAVTGLQVLHI